MNNAKQTKPREIGISLGFNSHLRIRWIHQVKISALVFIVLLISSEIGLLSAGFLSNSILQPTSKPRFAGGNVAERGQFPWIISIQYQQDEQWEHDCGGAIIDTKHIVTAGHCVWNRNASEIQIVAGAHNIKKDESSQQKRKLEHIYLHPNYTSGDAPGSFDIAIVRVAKAFNFNKHVKNVEVAKCNEEPEKGDICEYAGWGNLMPISPLYYKGSEVLMTESYTIIGLKECQSAYAVHKDALKTAICSKSEMLHGTCQGDSGGPLTCYSKGKKKSSSGPYLAGVVSFGFPVCNDGYHPDVYTSIGNPLVCNYFKEYEKLARKSKSPKKSELV